MYLVYNTYHTKNFFFFFSGWIIEHTSDMDNAFICLGVVDTVGGLAVIAVFIYVECFPRPHSRQYESIDEDSVETGVSNTKNRRK